MSEVKLTINGEEVRAPAGMTILEVALDAGIYIPHLCYHPQLDLSLQVDSLKRIYQGGIPKDGEEGRPFEGCNLCLVEIEGRNGLVNSCKTKAEDRMVVITDSVSLKSAREKNIAKILETHPHACLVCAQAEGCDRKICSLQIPEVERCCSKFGICELQKVSEFIGIEMGLPPYVPSHIPVVDDEPLIKRAYDLCIGCLRCVRICKEIKGADALGFTVQDGRVLVGSKKPSLRESGCQFCGFCVEVCPTGALLDKDVRAGKRETYLVPCRNQCPAEVDVPLYVRFIAEGKFSEASDVIRENVPFPSVLGRACFHPCETVCRRGKLDEPVAVCALKRAASDLGKPSKAESHFKEKTGKKVAVVGSGPAGLTGAYYLNRLGHTVTVFEALPEAGGMLRVGIPNYRLPRNVLDEEIKHILDEGVEMKASHRIESREELFSQGFEAAFMAFGSHKGINLRIPGEDAEGVADGVTFLRDVNTGSLKNYGESVAVIGGGNVAIDSARSVLRLGANDVTIFYRRTRNEMPAHDEEVELALEEGIKIEYQVTPKAIERRKEGLEVKFVRMEMGEPDESGRPRPLPIKNSKFTSEFDTVITAIGQYSEGIEGVGVPSGGERTMEVDAGKGVFVGGDFLTGPNTIIEAIASGRKAAILVDRFLGGDGDLNILNEERKNRKFLHEVRTVDMAKGREQMPKLPVDRRINDFSEVSLGLNEQSAISEANRCLGCDLRLQIKSPVMPPELHMALTEKNVGDVPEVEGIYVLYDEEKELYEISGVENIREALLEEIKTGSPAAYFDYEEDLMFTGKERQLIQQYMKKHGEMPPGNSELDDLF